jgi:hypothetical protein
LKWTQEETKTLKWTQEETKTLKWTQEEETLKWTQEEETSTRETIEILVNNQLETNSKLNSHSRAGISKILI